MPRDFHDIIEHLSEEKRAYVISQIDPFHDTPYKVSGAPSSLSGNSTVLTLNQQATYTAADFGLATTAGAKWDCHFVMFPIINPTPVVSGNLTKPTVFDSAGSLGVSAPHQFTMHSMSVHASGQSGLDVTFCEPNNVPNILGLDCTQVGQFVDGKGNLASRYLRLLGMSFEVVDATPKIYQQGSCTTYSYPQQEHVGSNFSALVGLTNPWPLTEVFGANRHLTMPPSNLATATAQPNSRTWPASKGAYVVGRKGRLETMFERLDARPILFHGSQPAIGDTTDNYAFMDETAYQYSGAVRNGNYPNAVWCYGVSGAYFTGLSGEYATLRLRYKTFWEVLPESSDTTLVTLATPTMPYDGELEHLIQEIYKELPVGVPQSDNPSGEFWRSVLRTGSEIGKAIQPIISALNPEAGALLAGATNAVDVGLARKRRSREKKKPIPAPKPKPLPRR